MNAHTAERSVPTTNSIEREQKNRLLEQKEALVNSLELREVIADVARVRGSLGDPNMAVDVDDLSAHEIDFDGVRAMMRASFDFRSNPDGSYGERWEAAERAEKFLMPAMTPEFEAKIYHVAELFGLTGDTEPTARDVDAGIILGAGGRAPLDRTRYIKELIDAGKLQTNTIISLGSERVVNDAERARAGEYAADAQTEFELMVAAVEDVYGIEVEAGDVQEWVDQSIEYDVPRKHRVVAIEATEEHPAVFIVSSAVTTDPYVDVSKNGRHVKALRTRANTRDTFHTLYQLAHFAPDAKVVAVTNAHFVPFQGAVAAGELGKMGVATEVVGFDPAHYDNPQKLPYELLQEILTVADSLASIETVE